MILVLAALDFEAVPFRKNSWVQDGTVAIGVTGVGPMLAQRGAIALIEQYHPDLVLGVGLCGSLLPESRVLDIVMPAEFSCEPQETRLCASHLPGIEQMGCMVSVPRIAATPEEKLHLRLTHEAQWVDQESYSWCRAAQAATVKFMVLRAVLDGANDYLPAWRRPASWGSTVRLPRRALLARKKLERAGRRLLCELL